MSTENVRKKYRFACVSLLHGYTLLWKKRSCPKLKKPGCNSVTGISVAISDCDAKTYVANTVTLAL